MMRVPHSCRPRAPLAARSEWCQDRRRQKLHRTFSPGCIGTGVHAGQVRLPVVGLDGADGSEERPGQAGTGRSAAHAEEGHRRGDHGGPHRFSACRHGRDGGRDGSHRAKMVRGRPRGAAVTSSWWTTTLNDRPLGQRVRETATQHPEVVFTREEESQSIWTCLICMDGQAPGRRPRCAVPSLSSMLQRHASPGTSAPS